MNEPEYQRVIDAPLRMNKVPKSFADHLIVPFRLATILGIVLIVSVACQYDDYSPNTERYKRPTAQSFPTSTPIPLHPCVKIALGYYWVVDPDIPDGTFKTKLKEIADRQIDENSVESANNLYYSVAGTEENYSRYSAAYDPDSWLLSHDLQTPSTISR